MALDNAYPTPVSQLTTMAQWESLFGQMGSGILQGVGSEFAPSLNSGSRLLNMATGAAVLKGFLTNGATPTSTSAPAASASPRIDRLVLRLDRTASSAANWVKPYIIQGTPSATPLAPALSSGLTGSWDLPICQYRANTDGSLSGLVDERYWLSGPVVRFTSAAVPSPAPPRIGINTTTKMIVWSDGSKWNSPSSDTGWSDLALNSTSFNQDSIPLGIRLVNGVVYVDGAVVLKADPTTQLRIATLPPGTTPTKSHSFLLYQDGGAILQGFAYASGTRIGQLWLTGNLAPGANGGVLRIGTSWPV